MSGLVRIRFDRLRIARALLARRVAVVDRVAQEPRRRAPTACAPGPGRAPWSGRGRGRAPRGRAASVSSTGRLNASDLPLAVPVVTIVWPRRAAPSASAWWDQSALDPGARERLAQRRVEVVRDRRRSRPPARRSRAVATSSLVAAAVSSTASQGYGASARWPRLAIVRSDLIRPFHHAQFPPELLRERKRETGHRGAARSRGGGHGRPDRRAAPALDGLIDQVLVVDAASRDGTAEIAGGAGAEVHQEAELLPEFGRVLGKGDAMWRALDGGRGRPGRLPRLRHARLRAATSPPGCSGR